MKRYCDSTSHLWVTWLFHFFQVTCQSFFVFTNRMFAFVRCKRSFEEILMWDTSFSIPEILSFCSVNQPYGWLTCKYMHHSILEDTQYKTLLIRSIFVCNRLLRYKNYSLGRVFCSTWRMSNCQSPILGNTITVERLKMRGYIPLLELYKQIKLIKAGGILRYDFLWLSEPPSTRPVRWVVWKPLPASVC